MQKVQFVSWAAALLVSGTLLGCAAKSSGSSEDGAVDTTDTAQTDSTDAADAADAADGDTTSFDKDTTGDTGVCEPFCQAGWECGSNGCPPGTCGECAGAETCNAQTRQCEKAPEPAKAYGEHCGVTAECHPYDYDGDGAADIKAWPACLQAQCESGICQLGGLGNVCTKPCTIKEDKTDAKGDSNPDGIEDPSVEVSDCDGASASSPYGTDWACVQISDPSQANPTRLCQAGTTFAPCVSNSDCPGTETCQIYYVSGQYSTRCATKRAGSNPGGAPCNENPANGEFAYCDGELCFGTGCVNQCGDNSHCSDFMECSKDQTIFGNAPEIVFDLCTGKSCDSNLECVGESYCRLFGNGETGEAFEIDPACSAIGKGASPLGGPCDADDTDAETGPECKGLCLNSGVCSSLCTSDTVCAGAPEAMLCSVVEDPIDLDDAIEGDDSLFVYGICVSYDGSKSECRTTADCSNGESCEFYQVFTDTGKLDGVGYCMKPATEGAGLGELCGGTTNVGCKTGFCLNLDDTSGVCSPLCESTSDCAQGILKTDANKDGLNQLCNGLTYGFGGTLENGKDTVYVPLCDQTSAKDSLADCSADYKCEEATELCLHNFIAFGATGAMKLEYLCSEKPEKPGTAKFGEKCSLAAEPAVADQCEELFCLPDVEKDEGFCSHYCKTNADCEGGSPDMVCDESNYYEQDGGATQTISFCRKAKSCTECNDDSQCTDGYVCGNIGGAGLNADLRCVPGCAIDADCEGKDGGDKCVATEDVDGKATETLGCVVDKCN